MLEVSLCYEYPRPEFEEESEANLMLLSDLKDAFPSSEIISSDSLL